MQTKKGKEAKGARPSTMNLGHWLSSCKCGLIGTDVGLLVSGGSGRWASRIGLLGLESFVGFGPVKNKLGFGPNWAWKSTYKMGCVGPNKNGLK